jgi:surface antigen
LHGSTPRPDGHPSYSGSIAARLRRVALPSIAVALLPLGGGCSYQLGGWMDKGDKAEVTGTVAPLKTATRGSDPASPDEADLTFAKVAAQSVLTREDAGASLPWENPTTGARGTVTPIAAAYQQDGFTCRDFLASYVRHGAESWLQGEACRVHQGTWEIKTMRPWKRT